MALPALVAVTPTSAQVPTGAVDVGRSSSPSPGPGNSGNKARDPIAGSVNNGQPASLGLPTTVSSDVPPSQQSSVQDELAQLEKNLDNLLAFKTAAQDAAQKDQKDDKLQKQVDLLQKQIEVQQKMIQLLLEHVQKQPIAGSPVEKLQTQIVTLEARSKQAAQRDYELSQAIDNLAEQRDADRRNGPQWPAPLKELFLPSQTNESPLSIYGTLVGGYQLFPSKGGEGQFFFDAIEPIFLLQLNDHILLESELEFGLKEVRVGYAQMDYVVNDWLTVVGGRFLGPVGFFNERLHPDWINKLPDFPLMMRQVSLADFSLNGVQARGASYVFGSPLKLEYSLYVANGLGVPGTGQLTDLANLGALKDTTTDVNEAMAFGGRLGLWLPKYGVNGGFSLFYNRPYGEDHGNDINLWDIDLNYHKGDWDFRFECAYMFQETKSFLESNIHRRGLYAQVAYRPYEACHRFIANTELVFRFSYARFSGIDPTTLDFTAFESPVDAPVDRDQYTFGINYYLAPSAVIKFAYEINREKGINLKDNVFLVQLAWGF
jgi:hypothetical protein